MVGVLALQGDFSAHAKRLEALGKECHEVRKAADLDHTQSIVIPGGESSVLLKLLDAELENRMIQMIAAGVPTLATCAGLILLAKQVRGPEQRSLGLLDVGVTRNAYGRQLDSFITSESTRKSPLLTTPFEAVFIRAPKIDWVGKDVEILAETNGSPTLVKQGNILGATFHPELSEDTAEIYQILLGLKSPGN